MIPQKQKYPLARVLCGVEELTHRVRHIKHVQPLLLERWRLLVFASHYGGRLKLIRVVGCHLLFAPCRSRDAPIIWRYHRLYGGGGGSRTRVQKYYLRKCLSSLTGDTTIYFYYNTPKVELCLVSKVWVNVGYVERIATISQNRVNNPEIVWRQIGLVRHDVLQVVARAVH
jgi:hypothetical protein